MIVLHAGARYVGLAWMLGGVLSTCSTESARARRSAPRHGAEAALRARAPSATSARSSCRCSATRSTTTSSRRRRCSCRRQRRRRCDRPGDDRGAVDLPRADVAADRRAATGGTAVGRARRARARQARRGGVRRRRGGDGDGARAPPRPGDRRGGPAPRRRGDRARRRRGARGGSRVAARRAHADRREHGVETIRYVVARARCRVILTAPARSAVA